MSQPTDGATEEPVLPVTSSDERAEGWGDRPGQADTDEERYLRERPPHH